MKARLFARTARPGWCAMPLKRAGHSAWEDRGAVDRLPTEYHAIGWGDEWETAEWLWHHHQSIASLFGLAADPARPTLRDLHLPKGARKELGNVDVAIALEGGGELLLEVKAPKVSLNKKEAPGAELARYLELRRTRKPRGAIAVALSDKPRGDFGRPGCSYDPGVWWEGAADDVPRWTLVLVRPRATHESLTDQVLAVAFDDIDEARSVIGEWDISSPYEDHLVAWRKELGPAIRGGARRPDERFAQKITLGRTATGVVKRGKRQENRWFVVVFEDEVFLSCWLDTGEHLSKSLAGWTVRKSGDGATYTERRLSLGKLGDFGDVAAALRANLPGAIRRELGL